MKIIIEIRNSPVKRFLVKLIEDEHIKEVKALIGKGKKEEAILKALSNGRFIKDLTERDMRVVSADLILTQDHACTDLT